MEICYEILGWGSLDVEYLENTMEEFNIRTEEIIDEVESLCLNKHDINSYIYATLYIGANQIKEELINRVKDFPNIINFLENDIEVNWENEIQDFDEGIYTNYLASGFDSILSDIKYDRIGILTEDEIIVILAEILDFDVNDYSDKK